MRVGVLECGEVAPELAARHGRYRDMFARLLAGRGIEIFGRAVWSGEDPGDPADADGWILSGSKHAVYEDHDWLPGLEAFARDALARGVPVVGICFGHQLLAKALGGRVEKAAAGWGLGATDYAGDAGPLRLNAVHQDQVVETPPGARVILSTDHCPVAGLAWDDLPAWSIQPHPEFDDAFLEGLVGLRRGTVYSDDLADAALARTGGRLDTDRAARMIEARLRGR